jgi:hypothetical protein
MIAVPLLAPIGDSRAPPLSFRITDHRAGRLRAPLRLWNQTRAARLSGEAWER